LKPLALDALDEELIAAARAAMREHYRPFWHTVAAALRSSDGRIFTGVHLGATVGRLAVCAEAVALGRAIMEGGVAPGGPFLRTAVAVRHPKPEEAGEIAIVSPCGACREMITDYARDALVIVPGTDGAPVKLPIATLLPLPYRR
jgi:cytidine deaminase